VFDLALIVHASVDPVQVCIGDKGSAVVALSRPVNALAELGHKVEQRVEFDF
jgi:transcription antitermination factor NusA-like protein